MTLKKIAELTKTSVATVSKAFSGNKEISKSTAERIFKVARELGCFDKYYKGARERKLIALIFPESESEYYGRQIGLLEREFDKRGADIIVALTRFESPKGARLFAELVQRFKVDGVVIKGSCAGLKNPDEIPLVVITQHKNIDSTLNSDTVSVDYQSGINQAVEVIKEYGHRRVGFIGETLTEYTANLLRIALRQSGLPVQEKHFIVTDKRFFEAGYDGMKQLIAGGDLPEVIVAAYDQIALGAMKCARDNGIVVPDDISFVGIDDLPGTEYAAIPLASIHVHMEDVCSNIADIIFKRIDNRYYRQRQQILISTSFNPRESLRKKS